MADPSERRLNLLALLLEAREPLTLEQIADELAGQYPEGEAARRGAFERDKQELRSLGVPIEQQVLSGDRAGATGYWVDRRAYELPDLGLTAEEREALQLAVAAVRVGGSSGDAALLKLGADDGDGEAAPLVAALPSLPALPRLFDAQARRAVVAFRYHGRPRSVEPYGLLTRDGFWYLVGLERESGQRKTFRVDRIEGEVTLGAPGAVEVPADFDVRRAVAGDPKAMGEGEPADALVAVDALRAASVVRDVGEAAVVERRADGSVVVRVPCTNRAAFRSWVLGLMEHAEVLEPAEVRDDLVAWLTAIAEGAAGGRPASTPEAPRRESAQREGSGQEGSRRESSPRAGARRAGPRPASERIQRLLILLPWLMARGGATVAEAAERFEVSERDLVRDLELAACCGLPPFLDEMIDVFVDDGQIHVGVPRLFTRPLRLTPAEGFSLLAAGQAALQLPGADPHGPLARALEKLSAALEATPNVAVEVARPPFLDVVKAAVEAHERLAITYYVASRDELTEREIDPQLTFLDRGRWYVVADDHLTGSERRFRIDRIERAEPTGEHFTARPVQPPTDGDWFADSAEARLVTLELPASAAWVAEAYPVYSVDSVDSVDSVEPVPDSGEGSGAGSDGRRRVVLPVVSERWLERVLLRAGPDAVVIDPPELAGLAASAARRVLARYG